MRLFAKLSRWGFNLSQFIPDLCDFLGNALMTHQAFSGRDKDDILSSPSDVCMVIIVPVIFGVVAAVLADSFQGDDIEKGVASSCSKEPESHESHTEEEKDELSETIDLETLNKSRTFMSNLKEGALICFSGFRELASTAFTYAALKGQLENISNEDNEDYLILPKGWDWLVIFFLSSLDLLYSASNELLEACEKIKKNNSKDPDLDSKFASKKIVTPKGALIHSLLRPIANSPNLQKFILNAGTLSHVLWHLVGVFLCLPEDLLNSYYQDFNSTNTTAQLDDSFAISGLSIGFLGLLVFGLYGTYYYRTIEGEENFQKLRTVYPDDDSETTRRRKTQTISWSPKKFRAIELGLRFTQGPLHGASDMMSPLILSKHLNLFGDNQLAYYAVSLAVGLPSWWGVQNSEVAESLQILKLRFKEAPAQRAIDREEKKSDEDIEQPGAASSSTPNDKSPETTTGPGI